MKLTTLAMIVLFSLVGTTSALAEAHVAPTEPAEAAEPEATTTPVAGTDGTSQQMPGKRMKRKCKGHGGMKHGGGRHGKGGHEKHHQVVQRLDLIEARMAKIEAMLESLMRR
jgi:hypothetical protein